ncbi:hypothetical protein [Halomonas salinarum]|uniref:hypothetical protein n=1 Tax=Halomonas salinarum TaxID=1158993 RepID=UPI00143C3516|nr:hypothetical protein [Halomonas salinarum]
MSKHRGIRQIVRDVANYILLVVLLSSVFFFGYLQQPKEMALMILACAIGGAFLNLDKFKWFRGAGFEAQLAETVEEAYATKEELDKLLADSEMQTQELLEKIEKAKDDAIAISIAMN